MKRFMVYKSRLHLVGSIMLILPPIVCAAITIYTKMPVFWIVALTATIVCTVLYINSRHAVGIDSNGITCFMFAKKICQVRWSHIQCAGIETVKTAYGESRYLYFSEKPMPKHFSWSINRNYVFVSLQPNLMSCLREMWDEKKVDQYFKHPEETDASVKTTVIFSNSRLWLLGCLLVVCLVMGLVFGIVGQSWEWLIVAALSLSGVLTVTAVLIRRKKAEVGK